MVQLLKTSCSFINLVKLQCLIISFQNPWSVAILVPELDNISLKPTGNDSLQCSGSILTEKFVLTAAHCFFDEIFPLPQQGHSNTTLTKFWPDSTAYSVAPIKVLYNQDSSGKTQIFPCKLFFYLKKILLHLLFSTNFKKGSYISKLKFLYILVSEVKFYQTKEMKKLD